MNRILVISIFLVLLSLGSGQAQNAGNSGRNPQEMISIPPLRMLIDSALHYSPLLNTKDIEIAIKDMESRAQRWEWTDYLQPFVEYRYGTVDQFDTYNGVVQASRFNVGARINLTIFDAINYRYKRELTGMAIELDSARRTEIELLISKEVISLWNMLMAYREIISLKSDHVETQALNLAEAKLRYQTGEVPIMELARITEIASKSQEELVLAKKEFRESMFLLSELVGRGDITTW